MVSTARRLRQLSPATRRALGLSLVIVAIAYVVLLLATYFELCPPSSSWPEPGELDRLLFETEPPVSRIERLLESAEGEMNRGGTMRPAFTDQSVGWKLLTEGMTTAERAALVADREGERLALLDWVRSGASREAYEHDDYVLLDRAGVRQITSSYVADSSRTQNDQLPRRVRIRTLLNDRCVTCHGENGRHDTARFIPLDSYQNLEPHLHAETTEFHGRAWLIASLAALYPFAIISAAVLQISNQPPGKRLTLMAVTGASLGIMTAYWLLGRPHTSALTGLLAAAAVAAVLGIVQTLHAANDLFQSLPKTSH
jgi:hypothetical protein